MSNVEQDLSTIRNNLNVEEEKEDIMKKLKESINALLKFTTQKNNEIFKSVNVDEIKINEFKTFSD